jgi:hypothetical protein
VTGRVTDAESGEGVEDASVAVVGSDIGVVTDPRGLFLLPRLEPGSYSPTP